MNPKDPKWAHDGPKMVHSASGPQLQRRRPPAALPSLGQSASARELPLPIKQPKARRFKASSRLETLNKYVATSGCYEVIDDMGRKDEAAKEKYGDAFEQSKLGGKLHRAFMSEIGEARLFARGDSG